MKAADRVSDRRPRRERLGRGPERGGALVLAILVLGILSVIGIALLQATSAESRIAANEWSVNRAFYASDSGIRWGTVGLTNPGVFLRRPEFTASPFGTVSFTLPSHSGALSGLFAAEQSGGDITVRLEAPSLVGRRHAPGGRINEGDDKSQFFYAYEVRSASRDEASARYAKALVADVEVGPLPARLPF
jgi:PilX N-terminal